MSIGLPRSRCTSRRWRRQKCLTRDQAAVACRCGGHGGQDVHGVSFQESENGQAHATLSLDRPGSIPSWHTSPSHGALRDLPA